MNKSSLCILVVFLLTLALPGAARTQDSETLLQINSGLACREQAPTRVFDENGADYWLQLGSSRVKIIGRASWKAQPVMREGRSWKAYPADQAVCQWIQRITVHHTHGLYTPQSLQTFHQNIADPKADIAYHFFIDEHGSIYEGRPLGIMGSHSEADNSFNLGIALNGNFQDQAPQEPQLKALKDSSLFGDSCE